MIKLYNTLTRKKEVFKPIKGKCVNLFVCGVTPYDYSHIGHARTYVVFDAFAKYLRSKGYNLFYLQNITDIDDKIIKRAEEKKIPAKKLAIEFEKEYLKDAKLLKISSVTKYARATEHIKEIINQVEKLFKKDFAYEISNDGIYYNISKFKEYGKLSGRTAVQAEDGTSRIDESVKKRNKGDFCLWKFSKSKNEPKWKSPWGFGRPGWHIEDTAIAEKYFGPQYDIHGGGRDLMFPHHEAEIAQMEAISGKKPFVRYWMHSGFLTVKSQKMSKSLGNFITIKDFLKKDSPRILRFLIIKTHYRSPLDYNEKQIFQVRQELEKIDRFIDRIEEFARKKSDSKKSFKKLIEKTKKDFEKYLNDDFNTPLTIAAFFNFISKINSEKEIPQNQAKEIIKFTKEIDEIFGFIIAPEEERLIKSVKITALAGAVVDIKKLVKEREEYRKKKDWRKADESRKKIEELGYQVEDTSQGPKIKKIR